MRTFRWLAFLLLVSLATATALLAPLGDNSGQVRAQEERNIVHLFLPYVAKRPSSGAVSRPTPTLTPLPTATATGTPTNTPTPTPTATSTSTPSPTHTPTPSPTPSQLEVLPNDSHFEESDGDMWIFGEVQNNTSYHWQYILVTARLFDRDGQLLASDAGDTALFILPAARKTCFNLYLRDPPPDWSYYELEVTSGSRVHHYYPLAHLVLLYSRPHLVSSNWYEIQGGIGNYGYAHDFAQVVGTLYDSDGHVMGCQSAVIHHIERGGVREFNLYYFERNDYFNVASYRLQVGGDWR